MFEIGDKVRIRSWEDMESEFGLTPFGAIDCEFYFPLEAKELCGTCFTITDIATSEFNWVDLPFNEDIDRYEGDNPALDKFYLSGDMLELVN